VKVLDAQGVEIDSPTLDWPADWGLTLRPHPSARGRHLRVRVEPNRPGAAPEVYPIFLPPVPDEYGTGDRLPGAPLRPAETGRYPHPEDATLDPLTAVTTPDPLLSDGWFANPAPAREPTRAAALRGIGTFDLLPSRVDSMAEFIDRFLQAR